MTLLRRLLREPLIHFLLLGGLLFAAYSALSEGDTLGADERVIVVDRDALVTFLQYRSAAFEPGYFDAQFDALSDEQIADLASAYVREEAMAREARALGLDQNDYVIKRRLVQKIEYLVTDVDLNDQPPTEAELQAYLDENPEEFRRDAEFTFTHVFLDAEKDHPGGIEAAARALLRRLNADGAQFNDAPSYGDRFPYQRNYVRQDLRPIANELGADFAIGLASMEPGDDWQGPLASNIGLHLVLFTDRTALHEPELDEIRPQVVAAVLEERQRQTRETLLDELVEQYDVRYDGVAPPEPGDGEG